MKNYSEMSKEINRISEEVEDLRVYSNKLMELRNNYTDDSAPQECYEERPLARSAEEESKAYTFLLYQDCTAVGGLNR